MHKYKIIFPFLMAVLMVSTAYSQENSKDRKIKTISGTVANIDFVGNTISVLTADQHQVSLYVPGNAIITKDTHDIGLMDVKPGHPVIIQYDSSSPGRDIVDSIVDNNPEGHE